MNNDSIFSTLDPEIVERARLSRRSALHKAAKAGFGAAVLTSVPVAFGLSAREAFGQSLPAAAIPVLQYALTLEYLEDDFYKAALAASNLIPTGPARTSVSLISTHETQHVALLRAALGSNAPATKPTFDFTGGNGANNGPFRPFSDYATFLALAQGFEDTGVRAYKGRAAELKGTETLTVALQIHSIEARHASQIRRLRGQKGWITGNTTDVAALQAVYNGEELANFTQSLSGIPATAVTEAFDEPLAPSAVANGSTGIADPFIVG